MKKSKFTDSQIMAILKQVEAGTPVPQVCREHGVCSATVRLAIASSTNSRMRMR
jgi:hypothetical protein